MQAPDTNARRSRRRRVLPLTLVALGALVLAAAPASAGTATGGAPASPPAPASSRSRPGSGTTAPHAPPAAKRRRRRKPGPPLTDVAIERAFPGEPVAGGFIGLSFEVGSLAQLAGYADTGDLVTLLRSLGPGVLRFGGVTADKNVAWVDARTPPPAWASAVIDEADLGRLGLSQPAAAGMCC